MFIHPRNLINFIRYTCCYKWVSKTALSTFLTLYFVFASFNLQYIEIFHLVYIERLPNKFIELFMHGILPRNLALRFFEAGFLEWPEKGHRRHGRSDNLLDFIGSVPSLNLFNKTRHTCVVSVDCKPEVIIMLKQQFWIYKILFMGKW